MADKSHSTTTPQSSTSSNPSIPDDSTTEYEPTPIHSPAGGPQYEDLPPSYDFALSDARNGGAALDASQIEAHRVSANEGPNEPEVWEYRMRSEGAEEPREHEEAPAYEGHVPVQHLTGSQNIPVGRVGDLSPSSTSIATRSTSAVDDPPHSVLDAATSGGSQARQAWGPFGAPGNGPFGAPGNGPFGAPGNGPFGPGRGFRGGSANFRGRGRRGRGSRSPQDWATFGQNMGRWGEEFGRRMGNWGEQFGRQAGAMGKQFGQRTEQWASAYSAGGGGYNPPTRPTPTAGPSNAEPAGPPQYDHPPSYEAPASVPGQETGVLYRNLGPNEYPPEKIPQSPSEKLSAMNLGKQHSKDYDDDDDDSSISSDSSESDSSFDEEDSDFDEIEAEYRSRIDAINKDAEIAASKGKSRELIEHEREIAIKEATRKKDTEEYVFTKRSARRTQKRMFRDRKRELTRDYRQRKRELWNKAESSGKGKGKAKKGSGMKELKKDFKAKRRALKRERMDAKRWWKDERRTMKQGPPEWIGSGAPPEQKVLKGKGKSPE